MNNKLERKNGILMHISSLPSKYGIGTLGLEAYKFVDFLNESKVKLWQVLPIGHTSYGDSPYQTYSIYAGNPYLIDLDLLINDGLLNNDELKEIKNSDYVDYGYLFNNKINVLRKACYRFDFYSNDYLRFVNENQWINDYSRFMTIKELKGFRGLNDFGEYKIYNRINFLEFDNKYNEKIKFWKFIQFVFFKQWFKLKDYSNSKNVEIIGDIPIYVPYDSVEVWKEPQLFMIDDNMEMEVVSGMPPDDFAKEGQVWGSPVYNYTNMRKDNYKWWVDRFKYSMKIFDYIRIDHFIGFVSFYGINGKTRNPLDGKWYNGGGFDLFNEVNKTIDRNKVIAEDLGYVSDEVRKLLEVTNYYCMRILEFGIKNNINNIHFPDNYPENCVCYTGTHDNQTLKSWIYSLNYDDKKFIENYTNQTDVDSIIDKLINKLFASRASIVIIPIQDYLKIADEGRMNTPGKSEGNWTWKLKSYDEYRKISFDIMKKNEVFNR